MLQQQVSEAQVQSVSPFVRSFPHPSFTFGTLPQASSYVTTVRVSTPMPGF